MRLSVVIPVYNEKDNIQPMLDALKDALEGISSEIIFVDDGSHDGTPELINESAKGKKNIRLVQFQRNFGQTSAMSAGIDTANGEFIATLDGDLQNDPSDIPEMMGYAIQEDYDLVTGIRQKRKDSLVKKIPSKIAIHCDDILTFCMVYSCG